MNAESVVRSPLLHELDKTSCVDSHVRPIDAQIGFTLKLLLGIDAWSGFGQRMTNAADGRSQALCGDAVSGAGPKSLEDGVTQAAAFLGKRDEHEHALIAPSRKRNRLAGNFTTKLT